MAAIHTTAHVSINHRNFSPPMAPIPSNRRKTGARCALSTKNSRRMFSISFLILQSSSSLPTDATASNIFDRYVKRKKLEPLENYVPAVILTQLQIKDIEESLEVDQPQYATYRSILRSGPAASFRSNIRAVAEYAFEGGRGKTAFDDVDQCLRALDELDSLLLRASRNNPDASAKLMKEKITIAVSALNRSAISALVCHHGLLVKAKYAKKGEHIGRRFLGCSQWPRDDCGFFKWEDEIHDNMVNELEVDLQKKEVMVA